jgi:tetratricopeptide (TPR) repeat protein
MTGEQLTDIISDPEKLTANDIPYFEGLVKQYPYFQIAHVLLLYCLNKYHKEKFDQQLQISAIYASDRKSLYNLLNNNSQTEFVQDFLEKELSSFEPVEFQFGDVKPELTIDDKVDTKAVLKDEAQQELLEIEDNDGESIDDQPRVVELDVTASTVNEIVEPVNTGKKDLTLIEKFLEENPAFVPNKLELNEIREDISVNSIQEDDGLVTETLATIFEMQKLYEKAISVYEKLILKIPEKSTYFASRINELKQNIK